MKASTLLPAWRSGHTPNAQEVTPGAVAGRKKDVKNDDRSHNVVKNKGVHDKMSYWRAHFFVTRAPSSREFAHSDQDVAVRNPLLTATGELARRQRACGGALRGGAGSPSFSRALHLPVWPRRRLATERHRAATGPEVGSRSAPRARRRLPASSLSRPTKKRRGRRGRHIWQEQIVMQQQRIRQTPLRSTPDVPRIPPDSGALLPARRKVLR